MTIEKAKANRFDLVITELCQEHVAENNRATFGSVQAFEKRNNELLDDIRVHGGLHGGVLFA